MLWLITQLPIAVVSPEEKSCWAGWMEAGRESEEGVLHFAGEHGGWKARRERTLLGEDDDEDEEEWVMTHSFMMICAAAQGDEGRLERTKREAGGSRLSGETNVGSG